MFPGRSNPRRRGSPRFGDTRRAMLQRDTVLALAFNGSEFSGTNANTDGDVDEVDFTNAAIYAAVANKRSVGFWVRPLLTASTRRTMVAKWDVGAAQGEWAVSQQSADGLNIQVDFSNAAGADAIAGSCITDNNVLTLDAWNHVVIVYDGAGATQTLRCRIYINGALVARTPSGTIPPTLITGGTSHLRAGRWNGRATGTALPSSMMLRDLQMWGSVALSDAEVAAVYAGDFHSYPAADGRWLLNGTLNDSTLQANNGTSSPIAPAGPQFVMRTQTWPTARGRVLLIQGDSITAGTGFPGAWRREFVAHLWHRYGKSVRLVGRYTDVGTPADFLNRYPHHSGLSGQKIGATGATGMRGEIEADIASFSPQGIIMLGGTNDIANDALTAAQTRDRLGLWIDEVRAVSTVPIWILGTPRRTDGFDATCTAYDDLLAALAAGKVNVTFVDACRRMSPRDMQAGSAQHPGDIGHRKIGAYLAQQIQASL